MAARALVVPVSFLYQLSFLLRDQEGLQRQCQFERQNLGRLANAVAALLEAKVSPQHDLSFRQRMLQKQSANPLKRLAVDWQRLSES